ncbi:WxL domain-containing protein [Companilactobacillus farciminis]|uniref:WxL domain-containing protein n=1 Tax=Companilactobacillus farciminis TaxID=1612 RepID=UPI00191627F2|nr:WxL domain-containing protein [Companilactobacillus farciminis]
MKLSRNVLVGSLATVGMVLGAVAPAVTAQAATTSGNIDGNGNVTMNSTDGKTPVESADYGVLGQDGTSIAFDGGDGTTYGTASANSNANVKVLSGVLVLQAVPDFGFGSGASGSTVALKDNNATGAGQDGNSQGLLQVTDARSETPGFSLTAKMGNFSQVGSTDAVTAGDAFEINLTSQKLLAGDGTNAGKVSPISSSEAKLISDNKTQATVMNPTAGSYKVGDLKAEFSDSSSASLSIPDGVAANDVTKPSVKSYTSMITWTLNASPKVTPAA